MESSNGKNKSTNQFNARKANHFDQRKKKQRDKFTPDFKKRVPTWKQIDEEVKQLQPEYDQIDANKIESFDDFPLSSRTKRGLQSGGYTNPTEIQRESIGIALRGYDLLGAAKTGSGKTLAFLIPILECLFNAKWTKLDGLGVLVISPTRELAYQTFEVLKKIGKHHDFSAGLVIGGKDLKTESKIINQTNIIICTPGRLLQHMDETWNFNCDNLKILVLDEADRILDMGFAETMNSILANLPTQRQTLLFSATQTKSIKDLARLSLNNPMFVSVHEHAAESTPSNLVQSYLVCETHEKISFLWSFIRNHLNQKIIVFFQSCKQIKFVYESFTRMQTGMTTLALYGTMNQIRRMDVYDQFCRKSHAVLFATDVAARGLDFPGINWVVQMDCPPDANTYIHRAGRTARYQKDGQSILVLTPTEESEMIAELSFKKIPISKIEANMRKVINIDTKMQSMCAADVQLKESAKRALMAYMRSIFLMNNKKIFDIESIDVVKFSSSLGLVVAPRIRFLKNAQTASNATKNAANDQENSDEPESGDEDTEKTPALKIKDKRKKLLLKRQQQDAAAAASSQLNFSQFTAPDGNSGESLFTVKRVFNPKKDGSDSDDDEELPDPRNKKIKIKTKASVIKHLKKKNIRMNESVKFDDEDNRIVTSINEPKSVNITDMLAAQMTEGKESESQQTSGIDIEEARRMLQNEDKFDKQLYRDRIKKIHREKRLKEKDIRRAKRARGDDGEQPAEVTLGSSGKDDAEENFNTAAGSDSDYSE